MAIKFTNNASASLAAAISSSSANITVVTGQGALFPALGAGDYFYATLFNSSNNLEIVKVTARAGDVLTALRGQEGTTARAFLSTDKIELRVTAAVLNDFAVESNDNTFTGANSFTGPVSFSAVPSFSGGALPIVNGGTGVTTAAALTALVGNLLFPVGAIYSSTSATNPGTSLGFGTWTQFAAGRMMMGAGGSFSPGTTGGSNDAITVAHTHTVNITSGAMNSNASHSHSTVLNYYSPDVAAGTFSRGGSANFTSSNGTNATNTDHTHNVSGTTASSGSSGTNANLPPYIVVYMWQRVP